jgi:hypothetical protein
MLRIVYDGLRSASVSERAHYAPGTVEPKDVAGKNSALLIPAKLLCLASGQPERWVTLETLLLKVFSIVQEIDDVLDLDEDVEARRSTTFSVMVFSRFDCIDLNNIETSLFAHQHILFLLQSFRAIVPELRLPSKISGDLLSSLTVAIDKISRVQIMPNFTSFKHGMIPLLPPIAAYGGI